MKAVYENNFYTWEQNGTFRLANSIWFKRYPIEEEYLRILWIIAESCRRSLDSEGHQNIIDWINHYTRFLELPGIICR